MRPRRPALVLGAALAVLAATAAAQDPPNGVLLVAAPQLADPNFRETVVLATRHTGGGTVGVVLNRPTAVPLHRALPRPAPFRGRADRLFAGGPVSPRALVVVFRSTAPPPETLRVLDDVYLTLDGPTVETLLARPAGPDRLRVYAGYAGWAPGQLELELTREDWAVLEPDAATIFRADPTTLWRELSRRASARPIRLRAAPRARSPDDRDATRIGPGPSQPGSPGKQRRRGPSGGTGPRREQP